MTPGRWVAVLLVAVLIVALVAFARGTVHHRGPQEVGALRGGSPSPALSTRAV